MTEKEKELIKSFALKSISKAKFLSRYPIDLLVDKDYPLRALENAYAAQNSDDVEYGMLVAFLLDRFSGSYANILSKLIVETWHFKHEDIASVLQDLRNSETVDCLYKAASLKLDYLNYDDTLALARKCIHALGDINTDYSKEKLQILATSNIPIIKE